MRRWMAMLAFVPTVLAAQGGGSTFVSLDSSTGIPALDARLTVRFEAIALHAAVTEIARLASLALTFDPALSGLERKVTLTLSDVPARSALQQVLTRSEVSARVSPSGQLVLVAVPRPRRAGSIRGTVRSSNLAPLPGARIDLVGTRFSAFSRDDGSFSLGRVPIGTYVLRAIRVGSKPEIRADIVVDTATRVLDLELETVAVPLAEVVVSPAYYGLLNASIAAPMALDRQQLETTPQLGDDIYRAMSRLPGVAADDYSAKFAVRGASGDELYVTLDGLQLIEPFHLRDLGNALSIIDIQTLGGAELIAGGAPAPFGDHSGGVLRMNSVSPRTDRLRGSTGLSIMNARAMAEGGFAHGKGGWLVSARRGYLDIALKLLDVTDSMQPRYYDLFGKVQYNAGRWGRLSAHALSAQDWLTFVDPPGELNSRYSSRYAWMRWQSSIGARLEQETVASIAGIEWRRDAIRTEPGVVTDFVKDVRSLGRVSLRHDWAAALTERAMLRIGGEVLKDRATYDYLGIFRRFEFVPPDSVAVRFDTTAVNEEPDGIRVGGYLSARVRPSSSVTVEAGARFDRATHSGDRTVSPRFNASWQPTRGTTLRGAWGHHVQSQPLFALQVQNGDRQFGPADRAEQREIGLEQWLPFALALRTQVYERRMTNERARWINAGSSMDLVPESQFDRRLIRPTAGHARGIESTLSRERGEHLEWSAAYVLSRITDDIEGVSVPRAVDQRHAVNLNWAIHPASNRWRLTAAVLWHSGRPYTPDNILVDTLENSPNRFAIHTEREIRALNSARNPSYTRVDARWTRYFDRRRGRAMLFTEVFNLFDARNVRSYTTQLNVNGRVVTLTQSPQESIRRLPAIGFSWEF